MRGELIEADLVYDVVGAFYAVYNHFGYGFRESVYMKSLEIELRERGHEVLHEIPVPLFYKGHLVGTQKIDRVVDRRLVLEGKTSDKFQLRDTAQLLSYLRASPFKVGLLLHFGPTPDFKRYVHTTKIDFEPPSLEDSNA